MTYFKIGSNDYSAYVNELKVEDEHRYNALTNAAGNTVVDYINHKRVIEVGIIPLDDEVMANLLKDLAAFNVYISFLNPQTKALELVNCIIPSTGIEYYTIQADKVMYKAFSIEFIEL